MTDGSVIRGSGRHHQPKEGGAVGGRFPPWQVEDTVYATDLQAEFGKIQGVAEKI
jgi:hypothetical protein